MVDRIFLLECCSKILLALSAIVMVSLALWGSAYTFLCLIPAAGAMGILSYCEIRKIDG